MSVDGESGPSRNFNPPADLFKSSDGQQLRLYVEPSAAPDSARLLRLLQRGGAVVTSPSDAEIFLISTENGDGNNSSNLNIRIAVRRGLIDEWDSPPERVVLDLEWAYAALRQNRVLLSADGWGGYHLGSTIGSPTVQHSPLPTPRQTPSDTAANSDSTSSMPIPLALKPGGSPQVPHANPQPPNAPQVPAHLIHQLVQPQTPYGFIATMTDILRHAQAAGVFPANMQPPLMNSPEHSSNDAALTSPDESQTPSSPNHHSKKGKLKSNGHRSKRQRSATESEEEDSSSDSNDHSERGQKKRQRECLNLAGSARRPGAIFVSDDGTPTALYLQLGIPNRNNHIESIKRNGGRIATKIEDATYAVLYAFDKHNYPGCLATCNQLEKPAVSPDFVKTCLDECKLMDAEYFLVEDAVVVTRKLGRGRHRIEVMRRDVAMRREAAAKEEEPATSSAKMSAQSRHAKVLSTKSKVAKTRVISSKVPPCVRSERAVLAASKLDRRPTSRSPSPALPPVEAVKWTEGKNMFTDEECTYMLQYTHKLFRRDPEATYSALSKKISEKMPQHPAGSWLSQLRKHEAEIERIRRRIAIQLRKTQVAFDDIVSWFVQGKADKLTDHAVWPALASKYPYMSDTDWMHFWENQDVSIIEEVEARRSSLNKSS